MIMRKIDSAKLFGIIGNPIRHSLSPYMHNAAFSRLKLKAVYLPFEVKRNRLRQALSFLKKNGVSGFNITIPFKSDCIRYLDGIDPIAKKIGAVNTVILRRGRLIGYNTDYAGFIKSLKEELSFNPKGKSAFILGAGGASRAVCFGLVREGIRSIYIYDIAGSKAKELAEAINRFSNRRKAKNCTGKDMGTCIKECQLLVNCTPLGMGKRDPLPVDPRLLHSGLSVYDLVYTPLETRLIKAAKKKRIKAVGGLGMLLYQGAAAFELWMRKTPPLSLMRKALLEKLR